MPQHQRTGALWTARRLSRRARIEVRLRFGANGRVGGEDRGGESPRTVVETDRPLSTLDATIQPVPGRFYRRLGWGDGEPHIARDEAARGGIDRVGQVERAGRADRAGKRTSLLYFAHHTDVHICDAQSPSRLESGERLAWLIPGTDAGHRPQEHATVHVFDQMIRATNALSTSPTSGAQMAFCIQTGDNTDNRQYGELRWFIDTLDGRTVTPNTGGPDYEGAQSASQFDWAYHPDDPSGDLYGRFGFPRLPGLLASALLPIKTEGISVPWLAVLGNHDMTWQGSFGNRNRFRLGDLGDRLSMSDAKPTRVWALVAALAAESMPKPFARAIEGVSSSRLLQVTPDPVARRPLSLGEQLAEFFVTADDPGPVGHGFTESNLAEGTAYWARPYGDRFTLVGLDTNNHTSGSEGRIGPRQFRWIEEQLRDAMSQQRLVIVFSHHNSLTIDNTVDDADDPGRCYEGGDMVELFGRYPNVILWLNGHDHEHRIAHHRGAVSDGWVGSKVTGHSPGGFVGRLGGGGFVGGFWEICSASCVDFGQQSRTVEVFDNMDGTLSVQSTVFDHAAPLTVPARSDGRYSAAEIASFSREFASNDSRWIDPWDLRGRPEDRNVELFIPDPFYEH